MQFSIGIVILTQGLNTPAQLCWHANPTDTLHFTVYLILPLGYYPETINQKV